MKEKNKKEILKQNGTLNMKAERVSSPLFLENPFFVADDLVQVKYEMLRKVFHDEESVRDAVKAFGFSRPSFYKAQTSLEQEGLVGLIPKKTGPRKAHKLTSDIIDFIQREQEKEGPLGAQKLKDLIEKNFGIRVHPRSIERALSKKKKRSSMPNRQTEE
jgi:transposase